ncbi:Uncharacterised protein [Achromobacter xylosoxidans]|nr:Uncharacterised protein [Achromobacter xylosoxidans]
MARHVQHIVDAAHDPEVAVRIALRAVAGQVVTAQFRREVALLEALRVAPDVADHRRPRALDHQETAIALVDVAAGLIDDGGGDARQRQRARTRLGRGGARQRRDHVAAGLGLPPGVDDGAALAADVLVIPDPGLGVDGFAHRADDAQAVQVVLGRMGLGRGLGGLDQRADRGGRGVEGGDLVTRDHVPEAAGVGERRHAFEHHLRQARGQRAVGDVGVAGDPAHVGRAPVDVVLARVEGPLDGQQRPQQVAGGRVLHALGLAGGAGRVQDEQRMLGVDRHRFAGVGLAGLDVVHPEVAAFVPGDLAAGAAVDDDARDGVAAAHGDGFLHRRLERDGLAAAHLFVGGDDQRSADVDDALLQALGREAAEHHRMRHAQAGAGLHGHHGLDRHGHVDDGAVALLVAQLGDAVGEAAHARQQFAVADLGDLAVIGLEDDGGLVGVAVGQVHVQAVGRDVQFAVAEPAVERRVGLVQHLGERLGPLQVVAGLAGPETVEILLDLRAQRVVRVHAGNRGALRRALGRREYPGFHQYGLNSIRHDLVSNL